MGYIKGNFDRGELAGKFAVIVVFDDKEDAKALASAIDGHEDPKRSSVSCHEVAASAYDIDYNTHKLVLGSAIPLSEED
jgi:hypothetical protein